MPVDVAQPQHPNPALGRALRSWEFNGWRGRARPQRAGGSSARLAAGHRCTGWNRGTAPALRVYFRGEVAAAKFCSRAWYFPGN